MDEPRWRRYLRLRGSDIGSDVEDELRFHIEMRERELLAEGMTPAQARHEALERFGNLDEIRRWLIAHDRSRQHRRQRLETWVEITRDVSYGLRKLRQQPGFTASVVLVLAIGIGATTTVFTAVDAVLLRPLPFVEEDRLARVESIGVPIDFPGEAKTAPDVTDLAALSDVFAGVAAYIPGGMNLSGVADPSRVRIAAVTPSFFSTLGVFPGIGRPFTPDEGVQGAARVAILSDPLWRRQFGADPGLLGREVSLNGRPYRVVGVMPRDFGFPAQTEVWFPMGLPLTLADLEPFGSGVFGEVVARLAPGVGFEQAGDRVRSLRAEYGLTTGGLQQTPAELVHPLRTSLIGDGGEILLILLGAAALVLLVACANVATLLLSRATARRREIALRTVLGATRGRILRQLLIESILLAGFGGAVGVLIAVSSVGALEALVPPELAGAAALRTDGRVLAFSLAVMLIAGLVFGSWGAAGTRRPEVGGMLRMGGTGSLAGENTSHSRRLLVIAEIALALMLLIGAGVMLRSLQTLLSADSGLQTEGLVTMEVALARAEYEGPAERRRFMLDVLDRLKTNPRFTEVAFVNELPLRGSAVPSFQIETDGRSLAMGEDPASAQRILVTSDYFLTMGIPMLSGTTLSAAAQSVNGPREIVINQELARILWPGENAVGKRAIVPGTGPVPFEVVGVVGDATVTRVGGGATPQMYWPLLQSTARDFALVARGSGPPERLAPWLREAVQAAAPGQVVYNVRTMDEVISSTIAPRLTSTWVVTISGALALLLAAVGIYGVIAYGVARRAREIGIRIALGAQPRRVIAQVVREGFVLAVVGTSVGLIGAFMLAQVLSGLVYGVSPRDPLTFVLAPAVLLLIAIVASVLPARRAATLDPAVVLRAE